MEQKEEKEDLIGQLEKLTKALEAGEYTSAQLKEVSTAISEAVKGGGKYGNALRAEDHMELAGKYLTNKAKEALSKKNGNMIAQYNKDLGNGNYVREAAVCHYFVCQVRKDKIEEGVKVISETINQLAEIGGIHSCLSPVSSVELAQMPFKHNVAAVFCFVHIYPDSYVLAKSMKYHVLEGGIGPEVHSLDIELPEGEFFAECRLAHQMTMLSTTKNNEARIHDMVQEYLKFLPEGTEFLGCRQTAIMDLSIPYELKFRNPLLQRVKRVELDYVREIAMLKEGEKEVLKQFNLFTGIRYLGVRPLSTDGKIEDLYGYRVQQN